MQNSEIHGATVARSSFQTTGAAGLGVLTETFTLDDEMPFGLELDAFLDYARGQFAKRFERTEKARVVGVAAGDLEEE